MIKLFPYQEKVLECILSDPNPSQLISMPTGTGKTITFLNVAKFIGKNCLILVHREELLSQTYEKSLLCGYDENDISIIRSGFKGEPRKLNIAMVQTLARNLEKYSPDKIDVMIVDEAHHSTANSYIEIFRHFKIFEEKKLLLGFTATPLRGDKKCLSSIYTSHSFKMTLSEATQNGYICPVHGVRVIIDKELSKIENFSGDYKIDDLDKIINCPSVNNIVAERCEHLKKVPAIIFCTSVDHSEKITKLLQEKKRKSVSVSYKTPKKDLEKIFSDLKAGEIEFITNAVKLSEGFDYPPIQTIISIRPTRSPVLYKQMIGRGLRKHEGKLDCFVMEFCGNDPEMMSWDDIDNNATFQSFTESQKKSLDEAKSFYRSRFKSPNVNVLDVRVSPFQFYECYIRRIEKFKNIYYIPHSRGFTVFFPKKTFLGKQDCRMYGFNLWCDEVFWIETYKSFYIWGESDYLWFQEGGWEFSQLIPQITLYSKKQCGGHLGRWYPSEEEPMTSLQKKILKAPLKMSARKAEMHIEDCAIKKAIQMFWIDKPMIDKGIGDQNDEPKSMDDIKIDKVKIQNIYELPGRY